MEKKKYIIVVLFVLFCLMISQRTFAKYIMQDTLNINVYLDKTPPIIDITTPEKTETFQETQIEIIKRAENFSIDTRDNVEVKQNQYYYNQSDANFDGIESQEFENGKEFAEEGFYQIVTTDTSGNVTKVIILLDKSAPDVFVKYFKKGSTSISLNSDYVRKVAGIRQYRTTQNVLNMTESLEELTDKNVEEIKEQEEIQETEEIIEQEKIQETEKIIEQEEKREEEEIDKITSEEEIKEIEKEEQDEVADEIVLKEEQIEMIDIEETEVDSEAENEIMLLSGDSYVGNEAEFRNALAIQASVIHVRQSIDFSSSIYINYDVTILGEGTSNSLRYGNGGNFIIVQNGGSLTIDRLVIDTNSSGVGGMNTINIQSGGFVKFINSSIIDGGPGNTGILINGNGSAVLWSCEIVRCNLGINLQTNGNLWFATQEGRCNNFYWNSIAIFIANFYGNCDLNQNISMHDNSHAVFIDNASGTIYISAGNYYQNTYGIHTHNNIGEKVTVSGGSYYSNQRAIWAGGNLNLTGGSIYNNTYGIFTDGAYSGKFKMTQGNIYSNTSYAIYHAKTNDGGCTITGGNISGAIYLAENNNYVNTNSSYPQFTVTPSSYYMKRRLVKTANNNTANSQISRVTVTQKNPWYKYVNNEYIVLWNGGNVIVRCKDYDGRILKQETMNGTVGTDYSVTAPKIVGYDLIKSPSNAQGKYTQSDIIVDLQYDLANIAKVTFEDLLSEVVSAKYWYNASGPNFTGDGTNFLSGNIFENYGYYKVVVTNGVGLEKEITFVLNKDSLTR